jgi:hypothetical protein
VAYLADLSVVGCGRRLVVYTMSSPAAANCSTARSIFCESSKMAFVVLFGRRVRVSSKYQRLFWPNAIRLNGNAPIAVMPNWLVDARMAAVSKPSSPSRARPLLDGLVMVSVLFVMMKSRFRRGSIMVHHTRRFSRDPAPVSAFLREKEWRLPAPQRVLRNSFGVVPVTRRKAFAKWLGLV